MATRYWPLAIVALPFVVVLAIAFSRGEPQDGTLTEPGLWTEINAEYDVSRDDLLTRFVLPLVRDLNVQSWHFFYEPQLRLRLKWADETDRLRARGELRRALDRAQTLGIIGDWHSGGEGHPGHVYARDPEAYSATLWPYVHADWQSGAEYAAQMAVEGLSHDERVYLWHRRAHLFANQALGAGSQTEARLAACHALGYTDETARRELQAAVIALGGCE